MIKNLHNKKPFKPIKLRPRLAEKPMILGDFQLLLWMIKAFEPNVAKLNLVSRKRWHSHLEKDALNIAFTAILERHEILSYRIKRWYPAQYKKAHHDFKVNEKDISAFANEESERILIKSVNQLLNFNWSTQHPQIIARMFYLQEGAMELQICLPHLIADNVSMDILWNDLSKFYHASITNEPSIKQLDVSKARSFNEYIFNEKKNIEANFEQDCKFWENYLHNTRLFTFPSEQIVQNMHLKQCGYSTYQAISLQILSELEQYCAMHRIGLNTVLCAAVSLALKKNVPNIQDEDQPVLMNLVKSTRNDQDWDETIGCFIRLDPIKVNISKQVDLLSVAKQIHHTIIENTTHMQASTILKLAYIRGKQKKWKTLSKILMVFYAKILQFFNLNYVSLPFIAHLSKPNQKNDYIICINLRNNFIMTVNNKQERAWLVDEKNINMYKYDLENFDNVCDISFLRDDDSKTPYIVISSNLKPDFRKRIASEIIDLLRDKN